MYKIAVIGGGHAGCEAALAASRLGVPSFLWSMNLDQIASLPCNPSIGGTAKGHLVREIDALGGEMGKVADATLIQSRMLGTSKGAAVHSLRAQMDRNAYGAEMKKRLEQQENLHLMQGEVVEIRRGELCSPVFEGSDPSNVGARPGSTVGDAVPGVPHFEEPTSTLNPESRTLNPIWLLTTKMGETHSYDAVILATGTFLNSNIIVGDCAYPAGPDGSLAATDLTNSLQNLGLAIKRFKTGTPARIHRRSIDFTALEEQHGDSEIIPFSFETEKKLENKASCFVAYTNETTHGIIRDNLHRSPLYGGKIEGIGPRYCPSIEDKIVRFADKERHQLFLEPMGLSTDEYYIQGLSTSLPPDVQAAMLHSIKGLENAEIMRYAYAIEYDAVDPSQLAHTLEYKNHAGLYGAGQINGTSGYEEAAAQGLIAGINAALKIKDAEPFILGRDEAYIGVLIDDIITKGVTEPYRMMTARAEFRLMLRQETADRRLTPHGHKIGLISQERYDKFLAKMARIDREIEILKNIKAKGTRSLVGDDAHIVPHFEGSDPGNVGATSGRPSSKDNLIRANPSNPCHPCAKKEFSFEALIAVEYAPYIEKHAAQLNQLRRMETTIIPENIDYLSIGGLRLEARQKLAQIRPATLGHASRIEGVNPADLAVLMVVLKKHS